MSYDPTLPQTETTMDDPNLLRFLLSGRALTMSDSIKALAFGCIHEFMSSWVAEDRNDYGRYLDRILITALYESLVGVAIGQTISVSLYDFLLKFYSIGLFLEVQSQSLELLLGVLIGLSLITVVLVERICSRVATGIIAGDRTFDQLGETLSVKVGPTVRITLITYAACVLVAPVVESQYWIILFNNAWLMLAIYSNTSIKQKRLKDAKERNRQKIREILGQGPGQVRANDVNGWN